MIRQLIFDLDGTLVDSCAICVEILSGMLADRGSEQTIDVTTARPWMSVGGAGMVAALLGTACTDPDRDIAEFRARYREMVTPPDSLFAGVAEGLTHLHDLGFSLSICSNKPQDLCEQVLEGTKIAGMFTSVVGLRSGMRPKPAPDLLAETLRTLRCLPGECLYVGDSEIDHEVADQAGIPFIFMSYGYAVPEYVPQEGVTFDCFRTMSRTVAKRVLSAQAA